MSDMKGKRVIAAAGGAEDGSRPRLPGPSEGRQLSNEIESHIGQKAAVMMIDTSIQETIREFAPGILGTI